VNAIRRLFVCVSVRLQCLRIAFTRWLHCIKPTAATRIHPAATRQISGTLEDLGGQTVALCLDSFDHLLTSVYSRSGFEQLLFVLLCRTNPRCSGPINASAYAQKNNKHVHNPNCSSSFKTHSKCVMTRSKQATLAYKAERK